MKLVLEITDIEAIKELTNHTNQQKFLEESILHYAKHLQNNAELEKKEETFSREDFEKMINDDNFWD